MSGSTGRIPARWLFFPPALAGLIVLIGSVLLSGGAEHVTEREHGVAVRTLTVAPGQLIPVLKSHGEARPDLVWQAVVQVPGRVGYRNPDLRDGAFVTAGTPLVAIDPRDYELALSRAQAQHSTAAAAVAELAVRQRNLEASVGIETRALELAEAELARRRLLADQGHLSRFEVDSEEQRMLRQQQNLQAMTSQLALVPSQREALRAQLAEAAVAVAKAEDDLARTRFVAPFDGRAREVGIEESQFVAVGQRMFALEATGAVEIVVRAPLEQLVSRFPGILGGSSFRLDDLTAAVVYRDQELELRWPAHVVRIDPSVDPYTRAAQLFVRVDNSAAPIPLSAHLYVEVEVRGPALTERIVVPRLALHDGDVFVVDADQRLRRRPVTVDFRQDEVAVIRDGLRPGDQIILTDLPYPVDGLLVHSLDETPDHAGTGATGTAANAVAAAAP
jgi:membrane fusion protein, multidrug efflux system